MTDSNPTNELLRLQAVRITNVPTGFITFGKKSGSDQIRLGPSKSIIIRLADIDSAQLSRLNSQGFVEVFGANVKNL